MSGHVEVRIVCTGGGAHSVVLAVFAPNPLRGPTRSWVGDEAGLRALPWSEWSMLEERGNGHHVGRAGDAVRRTADGWRFWCTVCRRGWHAPDAQLGDRVMRYARSGVSDIDLSKPLLT